MGLFSVEERYTTMQNKIINYHGISIPVPAVNTPTTDPTKVQTLKHPIEKALEKNNIGEAIYHIRVLAYGTLREAVSTNIYSNSNDGTYILQTTVALSAQVPVDCYSIDDNNRCVINNNQGKELDWDCDGRALTNNYYY